MRLHYIRSWYGSPLFLCNKVRIGLGVFSCGQPGSRISATRFYATFYWWRTVGTSSAVEYWVQDFIPCWLGWPSWRSCAFSHITWRLRDSLDKNSFSSVVFQNFSFRYKFYDVVVKVYVMWVWSDFVWRNMSFFDHVQRRWSDLERFGWSKNSFNPRTLHSARWERWTVRCW